MSYRLSGEQCSEPSCSKPVFQDGLCRGCWDLARAFRGLPSSVVTASDGAGEGEGAEGSPVPEADYWRTDAFTHELNAWRRA